MQILITNIEHYPDRPSGSARIAHEQAEYLAAAGHQVTVVAPYVDENAPECEALGNLRLLRYRPLRFHAADPRRAWAHQLPLKAVLRRHIRGPVDLVHGHAPLSYLAAWDLYKARARAAYTVHSPARMEMAISWPPDRLSNRVKRAFGLSLVNRMERKCLERSDVVTSLSDFTRRELARLHGPGIAARVTVVPGWVDLERFRVAENRAALKQELGWPSDSPVLFTLRRLVPRMGLDRLVRAVRIVRDRGLALRLVIGGAGPLRSQLLELIAALGLDDSVELIGHVPGPALPKMYAACDAFVLPTAALECFGLIAIEALACGRPVLATPVGAIPEVLSNFEPAWLARSNDEPAIADLLAAFLESRLPAKAPSDLRNRAQELYSQSARLAELAALVLPAQPGATGPPLPAFQQAGI